jgi:hypothetical protein
MDDRDVPDGEGRSEVSAKAAATEAEQRRLFLTGARELARLHEEVSGHA